MDLVQRKLHRLKNWDYSQNGYYFITVCTQNRCNILTADNTISSVSNVFTPTAIGNIVLSAWQRMSEIDGNIKTDGFCIMPNHIHGIVVIENQPPMENDAERRGRRSLHDLVRGFKSATTREYNKFVPEQMRNTLWQKSFYDEIIKSEKMLQEIRQYIDENPRKWQEDELYT